MNIAKVIRNYFLFLVLVVSAAGLSYNNNVNDYYVSVMHSVTDLVEELSDGMLSESGLLSVSSGLTDNLSFVDLGKNLFLDNPNENILNFKMTKDGYFVSPGSQNISMMTLLFKTGDEPMELKSVKLKVHGTEPSNIGKVMLYDGDDLLSLAERDGEYFSFSDLDFSMNNNSERGISLKADFGGELHTGERIRFDIEEADDLKLEVGGNSYIINQFYPIEGEYISIVRPRS